MSTFLKARELRRGTREPLLAGGLFQGSVDQPFEVAQRGAVGKSVPVDEEKWCSIDTQSLSFLSVGFNGGFKSMAV